jgi:hypothetical protein
VNIGTLFKRGFAIDLLPISQADALLSQVVAQNFVTSADYRDPGISSPLITDWDANTDREVIQVHNAPLHLQQAWRQLGESSMLSWFLNQFGPFSQGSVLVNKYIAGQAMGWHYDVPDATFLQVLVYLGDNDFVPEDGGALQLGKCRVNAAGNPDADSIIPIENVIPNHGTVVTILNTNPTLLHRVHPLQTPKNRYTLVCRYGYLENTFTVKKWRVLKGLDRS